MTNDSDIEKQIKKAFDESGMFLELLTESVRQKLDSEFEELMQILYRLDVSESKVQDVFRELPQRDWPVAIAKLIVEREKVRMEHRKRYSTGKSIFD